MIPTPCLSAYARESPRAYTSQGDIRRRGRQPTSAPCESRHPAGHNSAEIELVALEKITRALADLLGLALPQQHSSEVQADRFHQEPILNPAVGVQRHHPSPVTAIVAEYELRLHVVDEAAPATFEAAAAHVIPARACYGKRAAPAPRGDDTRIR